MSTSPIKAVRGARKLSVKKYDGLYNIVYVVAGDKSEYFYTPVVSYDTLRGANAAKNNFQAKENAKAKAKAAKAKAERSPTAQPSLKPIRTKLTKAQLLTELATDSGADAKTVKAVIASLENVIMRSIAPKGAGTFALPGVLVINTKKIKARKGGKIATSPFTGESYMTKDKPASIKVRVRVGTKLKQAASA